MAIEQLNETIQVKDKIIESEQKQIVSASDSMKDKEKFNGNQSDENLQLIT